MKNNFVLPLCIVTKARINLNKIEQQLKLKKIGKLNDCETFQTAHA